MGKNKQASVHLHLLVQEVATTPSKMKTLKRHARLNSAHWKSKREKLLNVSKLKSKNLPRTLNPSFLVASVVVTSVNPFSLVTRMLAKKLPKSARHLI